MRSLERDSKRCSSLGLSMTIVSNSSHSVDDFTMGLISLQNSFTVFLFLKQNGKDLIRNWERLGLLRDLWDYSFPWKCWMLDCYPNNWIKMNWETFLEVSVVSVVSPLWCSWTPKIVVGGRGFLDGGGGGGGFLDGGGGGGAMPGRGGIIPGRGGGASPFRGGGGGGPNPVHFIALVFIH